MNGHPEMEPMSAPIRAVFLSVTLASFAGAAHAQTAPDENDPFGEHPAEVSAGAEVKVGLDQHGGPTFQPALLAGPNALVRFGPFKLTGTFFVGFLENDPRIEPYLIAGLGF